MPACLLAGVVGILQLVVGNEWALDFGHTAATQFWLPNTNYKLPMTVHQWAAFCLRASFHRAPFPPLSPLILRAFPP
jgi:hypothetical protein